MGQEMEDWQTTFAAEVEAVLVQTQYTIRLIYGDDNLIYLLLLIGTNYNRVFRKDLFCDLILVADPHSSLDPDPVRYKNITTLNSYVLPTKSRS